MWTKLSFAAIAEADEEIPIEPGRVHRRRTGEALHHEREPLSVLQELRQTMSPEDWQAQYQQSPVPQGGGLIKREWIRYYEVEPDRRLATKIILSIDTASKTGPHNDWTVCTVWFVIDGVYYLIYMWRDRCEYPLLSVRP